MSDLHPYHAIAYRLWLDGYDLSTLYPSRVFKKHCEAIKTFSGVDVAAPLNASTNAESFCAAPMTTTKEEEARHAPASDAQA